MRVSNCPVTSSEHAIHHMFQHWVGSVGNCAGEIEVSGSEWQQPISQVTVDRVSLPVVLSSGLIGRLASLSRHNHQVHTVGSRNCDHVLIK